MDDEMGFRERKEPQAEEQPVRQLVPMRVGKS
jgi:hypothetical protein